MCSIIPVIALYSMYDDLNLFTCRITCFLAILCGIFPGDFGGAADGGTP